MRNALLLAWRYLTYHRVRTALLILCITLVVFLPWAVNRLVGHFEEDMGRRAESVPLLVGARGSRFDLALSSLYFKGQMRERLRMAEVDRLLHGDLCTAVPVYVRHSVRQRDRTYPIVGTTLDYFAERSLRVASGSLPLRLGDAVLGSLAAERLGVGPGDSVITQTEKLYDLTASYPLKMRVAGVLAASDSPDDSAVFVDLKTAWVIEGIGHGHQDVTKDVDPAAVLQREGGRVAVDESVVTYREITPETLASFHMHEAPEELPITAILVWPRDGKAATILKGRYRVSKTARMLVPRNVIEELLGFVFRMKRFFDANVITVSIATLLFLVLIVVLTLRLRRREMETLFKIGCSRTMVFRLQATELAIVLAAGVALGAVLSGVAFWYVVENHLIL